MKVTKNKDTNFCPWKDGSTQKIGVEDRCVGGSQKDSFWYLCKQMIFLILNINISLAIFSHYAWKGYVWDCEKCQNFT